MNHDRPRTPRSFRLTCAAPEIPPVLDLLRAQGYAFEPEPFSPHCRVLVREPAPLGGSLAAYFGLIYIQDRSSMLPPLVLDPPPGAGVLDMCASPGGKTGFLAQLAGPRGFVLANEPSRDRLETLRRNLSRIGACTAVTCNHQGQRLPLPDASFTHILCDAPCSGWGTAEKNPKVLSVWRQDNIGQLTALQRALIAEAARLLVPGGRLVYSTCTTNPAENEDVTRFALDHLPLRLASPPRPDGFTFLDPGDTRLSGVLKVDGQASGAQGFYICLMEKEGSSMGQAASIAPDSGEAMGEPLPAGVPGADMSALPPGVLRPVKHKAAFLPRQALALPRELGVRGLVLGSIAAGTFRPAARARIFLPEYAPELGLNAQDPGVLLKLISGQSLKTSLDAARPGLYFRGLKLGFLTRKGDRLLWSDR